MTLEAGERVRYRRRATGPRAAAMVCTCAGPPWAAWGPLLGPENMTKRDIAAARPGLRGGACGRVGSVACLLGDAERPLHVRTDNSDVASAMVRALQQQPAAMVAVREADPGGSGSPLGERPQRRKRARSVAVPA